MSQTDPYAPPQSSVAGMTPAEKAARDSGALSYSGFWQRVAAYIIDFLIVSPMIALDYFFGGESRLFQLYMLVPGQLIAVFLYIYMVVKFGGTPGKLLLGLRIVKVDGAPVTVKDALLRYGVLWIMTLVMSVMLIKAALSIPEETYSTLGYMARSAALSAAAPGMWAISVAMQIWVLGCIISILANKKRRALHDFIAGTVVVRK